ncbi:MAG TPA: amidohydrolase [Caulobacteraceae bacterium]
MAQTPAAADINARVSAVQPKMVSWRRDIHQHPELGNQETRTAKLVADHLRSLGLEVRTGVAKTGVIGVLRGGRPGKVVALRADMDALPVEEKTGLAFASKATAQYGGKTVPVMHACGHDSHTAMLMGAAEVLAGMKAQVPGTVVFIFQPAEEGAPPGEREAGAPVMVKTGALANPKPDAVFGMHVFPGPVGRIEVRAGPYMAGSDTFRIVYRGKGTHGAMPWAGVDVVSLSAATVGALNTIAARQIDVTETPTIITIGSLQAGTRFNIIPDEANLAGTLRTYGAERRKDVMARIERTVKGLSDSYGAKGEVVWEGTNPAVINDAAVTAAVIPALEQASGQAVVQNPKLRTVSEDFSYFNEVAPTVYWGVGSTPNFSTMEAAPANHSPQFNIDERVMPVGVKAYVLSALTFLGGPAARDR